MASPYDLPSVADILCFEAAARHLSFKVASSELNVTPAAVSHRIKALELDLGQALFIRHYRGVELTEAGALLFVSAQRAFETLSESVTRIRSQAARDGVTIAATTAMSALWLTPRLAAFWAEHPGIAISQNVQDGALVPGAQDLSIHYGDPEREGDETRILFRDRILALGTRAFADRHGIARLEDLHRAPLIRMVAVDRDWTGWNEWLRTLGRPRPEGPSFELNNYMITLQAATNDVGAVLGWDGLLGNYLDPDRLVQLVPEVVASPWPFYLRIHPRASANARLFADWLAREE